MAARLVTIPISHFCEKARWALDRAGVDYVEQRLRRMGVIAALEARGFEPGDDVELGGIVFELDPGSPL